MLKDKFLSKKIIFIKLLFCLVPPVDLSMTAAEIMFEDMKQFCSSLYNGCLCPLGGTNCGQKAEQEG